MTTPTPQTLAASAPAPAAAAATAGGLLPILAAAGIGLALVWFAGLSHAQAVHDAAHDVRHSVAFPCH
jgi:cobalt transporter subunit CbtB